MGTTWQKKIKGTKRSKNYDPKLELNEKVSFDDLFSVAIKHDLRKKKVAPKKKKKS